MTRHTSSGHKIEHLSFEDDFHDLDELGAEYGVFFFDGVLHDSDIYPIHHEGRRWIRVEDWRGYVRGLYEKVEGSHLLRSSAGLDERRTQLLNNNPSLKALHKAFMEYLTIAEPHVRVKQNAQTITLMAPGGLRAGLRLRAGRGDGRSRLRIVGTRAGEKREVSVRGEDDFEVARQFVIGEDAGQSIEQRVDADE